MKRFFYSWKSFYLIWRAGIKRQNALPGFRSHVELFA